MTRLSLRLPEIRAADALIDPRTGRTDIIDLTSRRVVPAVASPPRARDRLGTAAGVGAVLLLGAGTLWSMDSARRGRAQPVAPAAPSQPTVPAPPVAMVPAVPSPAPIVSSPPAPVGSVARAPAGAASAPPRPSDPTGSPTVLFDASAMPPTAPATPAGTGSGSDDFASRIGGIGGTTAVAAAAIDPKWTVGQGTLIPAILETAINTDVPGYVRAIVSADVRSYDGSRVLIPRSSRLIGQYRSGVQAGQKRAYVIWTRLMRPDGVAVAIASPAVGFGGETGLPGKVDNHFFQKFGSGMLLSVLGGLSTLGGGGSAVLLGGGPSAAAAAVSQGSQIGPTIRVRQGEPIRVFTARDLDFSKVDRE